MKKFIFVTTCDYNAKEWNTRKTNLKLKFVETCGDSDWSKGKTRAIKATKQNIKLLKQYALENSSNYVPCAFDCNGSKHTVYKVRTKNGKCWLTEHNRYDY